MTRWVDGDPLKVADTAVAHFGLDFARARQVGRGGGGTVCGSGTVFRAEQARLGRSLIVEAMVLRGLETLGADL